LVVALLLPAQVLAGANKGQDDVGPGPDEGPGYVGVVLDAAGKPVDDARVSATYRDGLAMVTRSNTAGAYKLPLVLCVINNGWAISVPRSAQTGAETLAQKGLAGGLHCLQVDGNDLIAVLEAMRRASARARSGEGGSVIEFMTYRLHDHTTADDARRYRGEDEVKAAWTREPFLRLRTYLTNAKLWDEAQEKAWIEDCGKLVDVEINAYLECPVQPVEAMFDHLYADPPPDLLAQRAAAVALEKRNG